MRGAERSRRGAAGRVAVQRSGTGVAGIAASRPAGGVVGGIASASEPGSALARGLPSEGTCDFVLMRSARGTWEGAPLGRAPRGGECGSASDQTGTQH